MGDTQIRQFRQGIGLTQEAMARRLDVTLASYSQIERGCRKAGRPFIEKMVKAFPDDDVLLLFFSSKAKGD